MMKPLSIFLLILLCANSNTPIKAQQVQGFGEMKNYYMVILKKGPVRNQDAATADTLQAAHLANIKKLMIEKIMVVAGPFTDDSEMRGIFILDVTSMEEARRITESDPAVKAGRLSYEIHPWMTLKGTCLN